MIKVKTNKISIYVISIYIFLIVAGCNEGGSVTTGSTSDTTIIETSKVISFIPEGNPVENSVYLEKESISNNEIVINVKIKKGMNVYGSAIELKYDSNNMLYVSSSKGDFLGGREETLFYSRLNKGLEGTLLIGISKKGNTLGVNGDGTLFIVMFKILTVQTDTALEFNKSSSVLKSPGGNIFGTSWFGGSLGLR